MWARHMYMADNNNTVCKLCAETFGITWRLSFFTNKGTCTAGCKKILTLDNELTNDEKILWLKAERLVHENRIPPSFDGRNQIEKRSWKCANDDDKEECNKMIKRLKVEETEKNYKLLLKNQCYTCQGKQIKRMQSCGIDVDELAMVKQLIGARCINCNNVTLVTFPPRAPPINTQFKNVKV